MRANPPEKTTQSRNTKTNHPKPSRLVILIPAWNEEETIADVIKSIPKRIAGVKSMPVVVIDDGSQDQTAKQAQKAGATVVSHPVNLGVGQALQTGFEKALELDADWVVNIDADGQFQPTHIRELLAPLQKREAAVCVASRFLDQSLTPPMPPVKYWGNRLLSKLLGLVLGLELTDVTCGFRAYTREAVLRLQLFGKFTYTQEMFISLAKNNLVVKEVAVEVLPTKRANGESRVVASVFDYTWRVLLILVRALRDYKPVLFFGFPGLFLFLLGLLSGGFTLLHYWRVGEITPYKSLGLLGLFSWAGSLLLFLFALLADMFDRLRTLEERNLYYQRRRYYQQKN